jgi:hypothetical protein
MIEGLMKARFRGTAGCLAFHVKRPSLNYPSIVSRVGDKTIVLVKQRRADQSCDILIVPFELHL